MGKKRDLRLLERKFAADKAQLFTDSPSYSIGNPALAEFLGMSGLWGGDVSETGALGLTAFYRAEALISGTIAALPLRVFRRTADGSREEVDHFLTTNPAGPYDLSAFSWTEMVLLHLLNWGEAFLRVIHDGAGQSIGLWPIHPSAINKVTWNGADKEFTVALVGGQREILSTGDIVQVLGLTTDGLRGMSPLSLFRRTLQTAQAGETAANRTFTSGSLVSGLVSSDEDIDEDEAKAIKSSLNSKLSGPEHAGDIAFVNRSLKFSPWSMTNQDAQFIESRRFSVEEVARIFGLPVNLLSATGAVSNWGTGVAEANLGLQKYVLAGWTSRIESTLRVILPPDQFCEFDFKGLLQGSPRDEIELLIEQVKAGILTADEARGIMNRPPLTPDQQPAQPQPAQPQPVGAN